MTQANGIGIPSESARSANRRGVGGSAASTREYDRRLSDKILAAFNHAYATGAHQVADRLRALLADVERNEQGTTESRSANAVSQADHWIGFIEARNRYNALVGSIDAAPETVQAALESMKEAYRVWADS